MNHHSTVPFLVAAFVGAIVVAGCGLKGSLALPEKSENVIIRGPGGEPVTGAVPATEGSGGAPDTEVSGGAPATESSSAEQVAPSGEASQTATAPATTPTTPPGSTPAVEPATAPRAKPAAPLDERLPPPPLPGGNPGASHGG